MKPTISPAVDRRARRRASAAMPPKRFVMSRTDRAAARRARRCVDGHRRRGAASVTRTVAGPSMSSSIDAAPSRNTERSTSGRSSSSAVGPWKRISPFSMKYAVSATVSATFTDCSTRMTVVPCALSVCARSRGAASTIVGASPSDSSSIISRRGCSMNAMPSVSICCWPPREVGRRARASRVAEHREHARARFHRVGRGVRLVLAVRASPRGAGSRRRSATGTRPGRPAPSTTPRAAISCGGV